MIVTGVRYKCERCDVMGEAQGTGKNLKCWCCGKGDRVDITTQFVKRA